MKERPILMSDPMALAVALNVKTQTRRIIKPQPSMVNFRGEPEPAFVGKALMPGYEAIGVRAFDGMQGAVRCPYGAVGDHLVIREAWLYVGPESGSYITEDVQAAKADPANQTTANVWYRASRPWEKVKWTPSIHMFRWACRSIREVTEIRVQRLQDISEEDAAAEGLKSWTKDGKLFKWAPFEQHISGEHDPVWAWRDMPTSARDAYAKLWDSINGKGSWDANPWVWAISFKRVESDPRAAGLILQGGGK